MCDKEREDRTKDNTPKRREWVIHRWNTWKISHRFGGRTASIFKV